MKSAIVTGATSMLGVALIEQCILNGVEVLAIVRPNTKRIERLPRSKKISVIEASLDSLKEVDINKSYDAFYHFGWLGTGKGERNDPVLQESNIRITLDAVNLAKRTGCKKFIGAGSQAEYGPRTSLTGPKSATSPQIPYGVAKLAAGSLSHLYSKENNITHIWARVFSVYGQNDNAGTMIDYAIDKFKNNEKALFSEGSQNWNYLYEKDAGVFFYLMGARCESDAIYCVGSDVTKPLKEYVLDIANIMGCEDKCEFAPKQEGAVAASLIPDISTLIEDTGYKPATSFRDGIKEILENENN